MKSHTTTIVLAGTALAAVVALSFAAGCGVSKVSEPFNDAPRAREWNGSADVVTMPDGFSNLATKCGPGGMRYSVIFHQDGAYGSVSVVPDGSCPK